MLIRPAPSVRVGAPDHNIAKRLWDSPPRVDDEAEQATDFEYRKWEFPITTKARAADESLRVFVCACVRACVSPVSNVYKIEPGKNDKTTKQIFERPLLSQSRDRDPEFSGLYDITVKWLRTRVGNTCIYTLAHRDKHVDTDTYSDTDN